MTKLKGNICSVKRRTDLYYGIDFQRAFDPCVPPAFHQLNLALHHVIMSYHIRRLSSVKSCDQTWVQLKIVASDCINQVKVFMYYMYLFQPYLFFNYFLGYYSYLSQKPRSWMLLRHFVCPCGSKTREGPFRSRPEKRGADGLLQANQEGIRKELQPGLTWNPRFTSISMTKISQIHSTRV